MHCSGSPSKLCTLAHPTELYLVTPVRPNRGSHSALHRPEQREALVARLDPTYKDSYASRLATHLPGLCTLDCRPYSWSSQHELQGMLIRPGAGSHLLDLDASSLPPTSWAAQLEMPGSDSCSCALAVGLRLAGGWEATSPPA